MMYRKWLTSTASMQKTMTSVFQVECLVLKKRTSVYCPQPYLKVANTRCTRVLLSTRFRVWAPTTFYQLSQDLCPFIDWPLLEISSKQQKIYRGANMTCNEKYELLQEQQQHLNQVQAERREFRDIVNKCKTVAQHHLKRLQASQHSSGNFRMHESFHFAQQVHFPSMSAQPGHKHFNIKKMWNVWCLLWGHPTEN